MASRRLWIAVAGLAVVAAYSQLRVFELDRQLQSMGRLSDQLKARTDESVRSVHEARDTALSSLRDTVASSLTSAAKTISDEQTRLFEVRLKHLTDELSKREAEAEAVQSKRDRVLNGLPEQVELDQLNDYYAEKWKQASGSYGPVEAFNTALGQIAFQKSHFSFAYLPSSKRLAWLKIGKNDSTENSELVKAWIEESAQAKVRLGYVRQYRTTKPSDYGEYTEALYRKGDMYFRTYLQYQRVQGTYDRHSRQYTYYVEVGSESRKRQYELEQYNQKLGS